MKQRTVEIVSDYLEHRPIGHVVGVRELANPDQFSVSIEDRRDGRTHVFLTTEHLEKWLRSFRQGCCLQPGWGYCDCCGDLHGDRDIDGELFALCFSCQRALKISAEARNSLLGVPSAERSVPPTLT